VTDWVEIHTLLHELKRSEVSHFFAYNEIKNILVDQHEVTSLESLLFALLKELDESQKEAILPYLITSSSPKLNRMALYELSTSLTPAVVQALRTIVLDKNNEWPRESWELLEEYHIDLGLGVGDFEALLENANYKKLLYLAPAMKRLDAKAIAHLKERFKSEIPSRTQHTYGDVTLHNFEVEILLRAMG